MKEKRQFEVSALTVVWGLWIGWMLLTTAFALTPDVYVKDFDRTMKIQLFSLLTIVLITTKDRLNVLIWVTVISLGFFGLKGGVFSVLTGGGNLVWGPPGSFIEGNNALGLALVMVLPLMYYLWTHATDRYVKLGLVGSMALTALAVLTTHSRGAFLALGSMAGFLWLKSSKKLITGLGLLLLAPILIGFMPEEWIERMWSIKDYQSDGSALGRINAWWFAFNLALDHPITGGGFGTFTRALFMRYAPVPEDYHDAHSIYFEVLGEHGFVGLGLFLTLGFLSLRTAGRVAKATRGVPDLTWAGDLMRVVQVALIGYAVGGLFLGLAYFDLYYHLIAIIVITRILVRKRLAELSRPTAAAAPTDADAAPDAAPTATGQRGRGAATPLAHRPVRIGERFNSQRRHG